MAEKYRYETPEGHRLCANNCGFFCSSTTLNLCSKCYRDLHRKCGTTFCGVHRYPEKHVCTFDFKKEGREAIIKANPLVVSEKLEKI